MAVTKMHRKHSSGKVEQRKCHLLPLLWELVISSHRLGVLGGGLLACKWDGNSGKQGWLLREVQERRRKR